MDSDEVGVAIFMAVIIMGGLYGLGSILQKINHNLITIIQLLEKAN